MPKVRVCSHCVFSDESSSSTYLPTYQEREGERRAAILPSDSCFQ